MNILHISATVCSFVSLLLLLISLGTDYWVEKENRHAGLWNLCVDSLCVPFGMNVLGPDHVTRAFLFIGMVAGAVSFFGLVAAIYQTHVGSISLVQMANAASIAAGLAAVIAMATFTQASLSSPVYYSWSFALGWASIPLFIITGALARFLQASLPA